MSLPLATSATTHPGLLHPKNEDSHAVFETEEGGIVLLVCDGMGGMGRGDEASRLAVDLLRAELTGGRGFPPDRLRIALRRADDEVRRQLCSSGEGNPGSTAVVVYVLDGAGHVAWVGDSRAYHLRRGVVIERTRDHKLVEELVDSGQLTPAQARASALAHVVTRALGGRSVREATVKPGSPGHVWKLLRGDRVVVMSDGVCDLLDDDEIARVTCEGTIEGARDRLVEIALKRGGHDNITAVVAEWTGPDWVEEEIATPVMRPGRELDDLLQDESTLHPDALPLLDTVGPQDPDDGRVTEEITADRSGRFPGADSDPGADPRPTGLPADAPTLPVAPLADPPAMPVAPLSAVRATPPPADRAAAQEPPPAAAAAVPPEAVRHPPPGPPGVTFDWRFLVAIVAMVAALLGLLAALTR
jgi:serine/threonine protein phosphatase PrpC